MNSTSIPLKQGTDAENRAAVAGALGLGGTYTVDEDGNFASERTFPNRNGLSRDTSRLTKTVQGEHHGTARICAERAASV